MQNQKIKLAPTAFIMLALMLLLLPLRWIFAALIAGLIHELSHAGAVLLLGGRIRGLHIGGDGAVMSAVPMSKGKELICSLAGPASGLVLLLFARWFPRLAVCAAFQALYNLLPVYPLDGGRALRCGAEILFPQWADGICKFMEYFTLGCVWAVSIYSCFWLKLGLVPIAIALAFWLKIKNTPCKEPHLKLQ